MRTVLEDDCDTLEGDLPAAIEWITHAGELLVSSRQEFPSGDGKGDPARGGERWTGKKGFCASRWELWMRRFEELAKSQQCSDEVKGLAAKAATEMQRLSEERDTHS